MLGLSSPDGTGRTKKLLSSLPLQGRAHPRCGMSPHGTWGGGGEAGGGGGQGGGGL